MRWSKQAGSRLTKPGISRRGSRSRPALAEASAQSLEMRRLFSGEYIATAIAPILAHPGNVSADSVTLNQHFNDSLLPGTLVTFQTTQGEIQVGLTDAATPQTVANFLTYVESGEYNDTIFHRSIDLTDGVSANGTDNGTIIQGGGYNISGGSIQHIPTNAPVADEYTNELYGDVAGTIAMAKTSDANTATSEWYFNVSDNTELDTPTTDSNGTATSYTVFGQIVGQSSYSTLQAIADLPTVDLTQLNQALQSVPVSGLTEAQIQAGAEPNGNNLVFVDSVTEEPGTSYTVNSSNPALVTPKVDNGVLSFTYGAGFGTADITITGSNLDGTSTSTSVLVTVPNAAAPGSGPTVVNTTAPFTVTGTTGIINVLGGDTDSIAALDPSTVTIVTAPTHGTASVNASTGQIAYSPNAGYVGPDTLTYTVADTQTNVSLPAAVTLDAVPGPLQVTVGAGGVTSLVFTQPNGFTGTLSVKGGSALVTFSSFQVNATPPVGGVVHAIGAGCNITNVTITNRVTNPVVTVKANGPITLGSIDDKARILIFNAPQASITGDCNVGGGMNELIAASLSNVNLVLGPSGVMFNLIVPTVTDTNITDVQVVQGISSTNWINSDNGKYSITAPSIGNLMVTGTFQETLNLDPALYEVNRYALFYVKVAHPDAAWNITGSIYYVNLGTPEAGWSLSATGVLQTLIVTGNLSNSVVAAAFSTVKVSGTTSDATIETMAPYSKKFTDIRSLTLSGAVTNTVIFSAGNINSVSAASMTNSRIYAGVNSSVAEDGVLASSTADFSGDAKITSVTITSKAANAFSQSLISADIIGSLRLGKINSSDNGTAEGVSGHTVSSISGILVPGGVLAASPANLKTAAALAAYEKLKKLTLGDFEINLI